MPKTSLALSKANGVVFLHFGREGERARVPKEDFGQDGANAYIRFVNADNFVSLMEALDAVFQDSAIDDLIPIHGFATMTGVSVTVRDINRMYPDATETDRKNNEAAIEQWALSNSAAAPFTEFRSHEHPYWDTTSALPLQTVIDMRNDLYRVCAILAWLNGRATFTQAFAATGLGGKKNRTDSETLNPDAIRQREVLTIREGSALARYYAELSERPKHARLTLAYEAIHDNGGKPFGKAGNKSIEKAATKRDSKNYFVFTASAFTTGFMNMMLSDTHSKIDPIVSDAPFVGKSEPEANTILADMYRFFVDGLSKTGKHSLAVCPYCGKFFEKQRESKKYCSPSCRSNTQKRRGNAQQAKPAR